MCGIVGYVGGGDCRGILVEALEKLEYRGYDSAGIATLCDGKVVTVKAKGKIAEGLIPRLKLPGYDELKHAKVGIGHTRWATHGEPSDVNSHPHGNERIAIVHNGIIENYRDIKAFLVKAGYTFESETDTETIVKLIDYYYEHRFVKDINSAVDAITRAVSELSGAYALGIVFSDYPDKIFATRKESPLIVGKGENEYFIASDVAAVITHTKDYYLLEHGELAILSLTNGGVAGDGGSGAAGKAGGVCDGEVGAEVTFYDYHGGVVEKELLRVDWDSEAAQKGGYEHFMLKEIYEQPEAVRRTLSPRITDGKPDFAECGLTADKLREYDNIFIIGCGSAMHAGIVGKYVIEKLARASVTVDIASEFRYRDPLLGGNDLVVAISQSGETADTLAALKLANGAGCDTLAIVNVVGSSIAREAKMVMYTGAGPEISVCSTKAYMVQCVFMYLLAFAAAFAKGKITEDECTAYTTQLLAIPEVIEKCLSDVTAEQQVATRLTNTESLLYIGRGLDYALSMEGSLKLKEISYIHSESYAAGELKHGTISLITAGMPVVAIATQTALAAKTLSNIKEVKSRGASVILVATNAALADGGVGGGIDSISADMADYVIEIPHVSDLLSPLAAVVPLQLIAYYTAVLRGNDVDKPRNLAKSVTVE